MAKERDEHHEEAEIISIADENGEESDFEVIMKFEVDDPESKYMAQKYMMVVPLDDDDQDDDGVDEVYAFRYEEEGDNLTLYTIEEEEEWDMVEETFNTLLAEFD
ncbi:UPF0473 protein [Insulibacter thermoxylanivorax]|uniref:UPF0473 protein PRECH8_22200 n=1 Tax=Insulibacter thermoxylanivorax TaxID=2749268 RepID=A0A916QFY3_9BACL|nr:DUF1292 domain-containing protein [Insulibacter thermoxylanivorax]GFR38924.1 UPF0473 protein [Insulibacter thermoxylanivorax]